MGLISILQGEELKEDNIRALSAIENSVYNSSDFIAGPEVYLEWFNAYKTSFILAFEINKVIGGFISLSLNAKAYQKMREGKILDSEIKKEEIIPPVSAGVYDFYIADVMLSPNYQNRLGILSRLIHSYYKNLREKAKKEIFAGHILADVCSENGERLCKQFGMKKIKESGHNSKIYEI